MISLSFNDLDNMKRAIRQHLPDVKNSHRMEAMARGLGFKTYASMLVRLDVSENTILIGVDQDAFDKYLIDKGFGDGEAVDLAEALYFLKIRGEAA